MAAGGITAKAGMAFGCEAGLSPGLAGFHDFPLSFFMIS
jgi:hypothetical protein